MSEYFRQLEQKLGDAVERRAHRRWYSRLQPLGRRSRILAVVIAALVVATPAVGAAAGWFSPGAPDQSIPVSAAYGVGVVEPRGYRMLPLRVSDPAGGPQWGLRLIRTTRGDTCVQLGRVENGRLGTLGIDGAWHNDHLFHPIGPNDTLGDVCGLTDAAGHGFVSVDYGAAEASADASIGSGQAPACNVRSAVADRRQEIKIVERRHPQKGSPLWRLLQRLRRDWNPLPICPKDERVIMVGLLGPDATSVTYRTLSGRLATERAVGGVGAYLIVLPRTPGDECDYGGVAIPNLGCGYGGGGGPMLSNHGAITSVTYKDGRSCSVAPPSGLAAAYNLFTAKVARLPAHATAEWKRLRRQFYRAEHVNGRNLYAKLLPSCPIVGWVRSKTPPITAADLVTPLTVHASTKRHGTCYGGVSGSAPVITCERVSVSFIAREPVTRDGSGYEVDIELPDGGGQGQGNGRDVRAGQRLTFHMTLPLQQVGVCRVTVTYTPPPEELSNPIQPTHGLRRPGSLVVGRFSFRVTAHH